MVCEKGQKLFSMFPLVLAGSWVDCSTREDTITAGEENENCSLWN